MATEFANLLTLSGNPDAVRAFLLAAEAAEVVTASAMTRLPDDRISIDSGRMNMDLEFVTSGSPAFDPIGQIAESHPEVVVSIASVEPASELAEIRVHLGSESWIAELDEIEKGECSDPENGYLMESEAFDVLASTAASVIDDYEQKLVRAPAPSV